MSDAYIIEVADEAAGIVVRLDSEQHFRFHASQPTYRELDGREFAKPRDAERAVHEAFKRSRSGRAAA